MLLAMPVAAARADDTAMEMWQAQRSTFESFVRNMRPLNKHRIEDILQLRMDKRFLAVYTPLSDMPGDQSMRTTIDGFHGTALVDVHRNDAGNIAAPPDRFILNLMDFPAVKRTSTLSIGASLQPNQLTISETFQIVEGPLQQVMLTQNRGPQSSGAGLVQLSVTESRGLNLAPEQLNFEAADFAGFVRQYPRETERYVRPLLRSLGQEAVFAPDPMIAWQVFSELRKPEPGLAREIQGLLPWLNSDDYRTRNAALARIRRLGRDGATVLIHLDRTKLTPEQNARIDRVLTQYGQLAPRDILRLRNDPGFLLDCLYSDDVAVRRTAIERLRLTFRLDLQFDVNADEASRTATVASLRQHLLPLHAALSR